MKNQTEIAAGQLPMPPAGDLFGSLAGSVLHEDDIVAPVGEAWNTPR